MSERVNSVSTHLSGSLIAYLIATVTFGGLLALTGSTPRWSLLLAGSFAYLSLGAISVKEPLIFVVTFLVVLEVFPPFFFTQTGGTPVFLSFFLLPIGGAIIVSRLRDLRFGGDSIASGLEIFLVATALSIPFAWWSSGVRAGTESFSHWLLLSQMILIYYLIRGGARVRETPCERWAFRVLLAGALISATYGIIDFVWPVPFPHPAADQFIWLGSVILRRAQGVFYESSNFANFCGLFLVVTSAALLGQKEKSLGIQRPVLTALVAIFGLAVLVSFSRSTWAAVFVALIVFASITGNVKVRRGAVFLLVLAIPLFLLWKFSPELWTYLLDARVGKLAEIFVSPDAATSGRFDTWRHVLSIVIENPQYLVFGVGYKTLSLTRLFHGEIIVDNGYLSLLLETGLVGLGGFLYFSWTILRTFFTLARARDQRVAFWSTVLFSFWCGQLVQLLAVDAYTFWRNMAIFAALAAFTLNRAARTASLEKNDNSAYRTIMSAESFR
ncbi:MAG: O-antigen ligase domain-containing protein [Acidobacteria bacterium]|nr:MAG: O-antigen ligase domain-containing protein [Acidobacteriota bacterium]